MAVHGVSLADLSRDPGEVARGLSTWLRGDPDEAALETLAASSRDLHSRGYRLWCWSGRTADGAPAWALPVPSPVASAFRPRGPARALARCVAAAVAAGAEPAALRVLDWRGFVCLVIPGCEEELADLALTDAHPAPARARLAALPPEVSLGGVPLPLPRASSPEDDGLTALAHAIGVHPLHVAVSLAAHGVPVDEPSYPPELVGSLREWGLSGDGPAPVAAPEASLDPDDDPCPRRRHARKLLRRLLRMGKVGSQYHTSFDHVYRGAAPDLRREALDVGEALVRAGLLGEKPSVGQRHVFLRREALPEIHALIDRGETRSPALAELWTAPAPGDAATAPREP